MIKYSEKIKRLIENHGKPPREVYFDNENSGYVPREVVDAVRKYYEEIGFGNPAITHLKGWEALEAIYSAKEIVAETIGSKNPDEIVFTHSGTESNNLAIAGTLLTRRKQGGKVIVSAIEHLSVLNTARFYANLLGYKIIVLPVDREGFIDIEFLKTLLDKDVVLVSIQVVNHEIGVIQPYEEIAKVVKDKSEDIVLHMDAADAYGWVPIDVGKLGVDLLTISSHKINGPRGVGVLYVKEGVVLEPTIKGQHSVESLWPGVENTPLIHGFRKAVEILFRDVDKRISYVRGLRDRLFDGILNNIDDVLVNGPLGDKRVANNVNVSFLKVEGEAITVELSLRGIYVSSGSACTSRVLEPSHVLLAIGRKHEEAHGSILFKLTQYHTVEDIDYTLSILPEAIGRLRKISSWK
ncbi:MAG: cysteine desulfurase family protein [Desulfurococcaceae archaeon]